MPRFSYTARDTAGAAAAGEVVARTSADAVRQLRSEGMFVVKLDEVREAANSTARPLSGSRRVRHDEVIYFLNQLAGMVDTGVPIADALEAAIEKSPPGVFRRTIEDVIQRVQGGSELSAALAAHPRAFSPMVVHMIRASEATGTLGRMLCRIADYMINQREIRKKVKGALTYPICLLVFAIGATIFLLSFVLPKFTAIYAHKQAILPLPTRILMATSEWMVGNWFYVVAGSLAAVVGSIMFFRSARGGWLADWLRLNTPVFGRIFRQTCLVRALRTLGSMIEAGVSVLDAIRISRDVVGNRLFARAFDEVHRRLENGEQLSQALLDMPYIPRPVWQMLNAGERTGHLDRAMSRVADLGETDLHYTIRTATHFIEPAMIVVMGAIIGTIALAVLLPIFQVSRVMVQ